MAMCSEHFTLRQGTAPWTGGMSYSIKEREASGL